MVKKLISAFLLTQIFACREEPQKSESSQHAFVNRTIDFVVSQRANETIELPFIYTDLVSEIPSDANESSILADALKEKGFKVVNWGRGNYPPRGPRIVSLTLLKKDCICEVNKIYYFTTADSLYELSERIKCRDSIKLIK